MATSITNPMIEEVYNAHMVTGVKVGKVLVAGSGGFIMFFDPA